MIRIQVIAQCLHLLRCLIRSNDNTSKYGQLQITKCLCCWRGESENLTQSDPHKVWRTYIQLLQIPCHKQQRDMRVRYYLWLLTQSFTIGCALIWNWFGSKPVCEPSVNTSFIFSTGQRSEQAISSKAQCAGVNSKAQQPWWSPQVTYSHTAPPDQ